jgi:hypothetical protein
MSVSLTIDLDEAMLARAKEVAARRNMSVEDYVRRLLHVVTQPPPARNELGPITRSLLGILPPMTDEEVERAIDEYRMEKYGQGLNQRT